MCVLNRVMTQMLLVTTIGFYFLFYFDINITYFIKVCLIYLHSVYMEGHSGFNIDYLYQYVMVKPKTRWVCFPIENKSDRTSAKCPGRLIQNCHLSCYCQKR